MHWIMKKVGEIIELSCVVLKTVPSDFFMIDIFLLGFFTLRAVFRLCFLGQKPLRATVSSFE